MNASGLKRYIPRKDIEAVLADRKRVTALLDATCLPGLPEWIDSRAAEALCLFKGDTALKMRDVAPYLVRSEKLLSTFADVRNSPWAMWYKRPGILILSDLDLAALQKHFRRFLRPEKQGHTYFFRFWEPEPAMAYFECLDRNESDRQRWFYPREGGRIDALLVPDAESDQLRVFAAGPPMPDSDHVMQPFALKDAEFSALQASRIQHDLTAIMALIAQTFPQQISRLDSLALDKAVRRSVSRMAEFGIRQRNNAFRVAAWDLHSDGRFEQRDRDGRLRQILEAEMPETDKMRRLTERLSELEKVAQDQPNM